MDYLFDIQCINLLSLQISYASTSATLSDRSVYPNLFRTVPSDEPMAPALATVMQYYGWRQLSILTEEEQQFLTVFVPLSQITNFTYSIIAQLLCFVLYSFYQIWTLLFQMHKSQQRIPFDSLKEAYQKQLKLYL